MATLAKIIGGLSLSVLALGLWGLLYRGPILLVLLFWFLVLAWETRPPIRRVWQFSITEIKKEWLLFLLLAGLMAVNLVGALGPELSFDALFYHLTLPKIYLSQGRIFPLLGGLFYASEMPRLTEMLYAIALTFGNEIWAKLIHFSFGILVAGALFRLIRRYFSVRTAILGVLIFYSSLVVGWQSTTAYIDLARTFFELLALDYFLRWFYNAKWPEKEKISDLVTSALMLGLAASTKIFALGSLGIFGILILLKKQKKFMRYVTCYMFFAVLIVLPWPILTFRATGNPIYPIGAGILDPTHEITRFSLSRFVIDFWNFFQRSADPLSPVFLVLLPLSIFGLKGQKPVVKTVALYCLLAYAVWYFIPRTGGGRYGLPYLPAFSFLAASSFSVRWPKIIRRAALASVLLFACFSLVYRLGANLKYLPYVLGRETKAEFLKSNLNFSVGNFYDIDGWFAQNIRQDDLVLIYGIHNLYYVNFPFIHESCAKHGTRFTYILVQNMDLPERFGTRRLVYENNTTGVKLYAFGEKF
ncbi:hypothetical protein FJZ40_02450 [Candidatus Shapirobacteria bacterium]|nr:hypothetical protein [Candidatus Shapirobacteria bacterium]